MTRPFPATPEPPRPVPTATATPWPVVNGRQAAWIAVAWTLALVGLSVWGHPTPFYRVETDLVGEYLPAARELARGIVSGSHYAFKGPGYPLMLAWAAVPFGGDVEFAARVLGPVAAGCAAWFAFALARVAMGPAVATFTLLAMLAMPIQFRYAIEAGTDAPALALMLASTWLVLRNGSARSFVLAGLLAGYAMLTRGNAVFLLPCAALVIAARPGRLARYAAFGCAVALPLLAWRWIAERSGGLPADRNYLNIAWELYGHGVPWDRFETTTGTRFHSLFEVLAFDPLRACTHILRNLAGYRLLDLQQLTTPWLGVLAMPGLVRLAATRAARPWLLYAIGCAVLLAPVFYNARFALYLLPLYLAAAGASLEWLALRVRAYAITHRVPTQLAQAMIPGVAAAMIVGLAAGAVVVSTRELADAPHEVRLAGAALARFAVPGARIMARKPHVAWYAHMQYVPYPTSASLEDLPALARAAGAEYLFFSGIEQVMRPNDAVLADSGLALPGFQQVMWSRLPRGHFYSVYRLSSTHATHAEFSAALHDALLRYEAKRPGSPEAMLFVAAELYELGAVAEALARLERLERGGAHDPAVERYRSLALLASGDLEGAARACEQAMAIETPVAWHYQQLGETRARQARMSEARDAFARGVEVEPTNLACLESLGRAEIALRDFPAAAAAFEQRLRLVPGDIAARRDAMGAWKLAGNEVRVRQLFADGVSGGASAAALAGTTTPAR